MKQKTIKTQKLIFQKLPFPDDPLLIFEISGNEKDVEEATLRIRNQVLRMQNGIWDEAHS